MMDETQKAAAEEGICGFVDPNLTDDGDIEAPLTAGNYAFSYYVSGPLLTFFIVIGLLGNAACMYVFRPFRNAGTRGTPPIYIYLFGLAMWDFVLLCSSFMLYNLPELTRGSILTDPNYVSTRPYVYCTTNAAHTISNWVVVALGVERYFALCHPFKHRMLDDGRRRAAYVVTGISVAGILYSLPRLFEVLYEFSSVPECIVNEDGALELLSDSSSETTVRQNVLYRTLYKIVGGTVLYSVGPFLCLLLVSIRVSAAIRKQRSFRNRNLQQCCQTDQPQPNGKRDHQNNTTRDNCSHSINIMLVAVMVKLLFVHALPTGLDVAETAMRDEEFSNDQTIEYLINFLTLLLAVNSSCNFFIYYICSKRFRAALPKPWRFKRGFEPLSTYGGGCCRGRYQESCVTTSLASTVIANEHAVGREPPVDV